MYRICVEIHVLLFTQIQKILCCKLKYNKMHLIAIFCGIIIIYEHDIQNMEIQLWIKITIKTVTQRTL